MVQINSLKLKSEIKNKHVKQRFESSSDNMYKMKLEYYIIIITLISVVIFGSLLIYLLTKNKKTDTQVTPGKKSTAKETSKTGNFEDTTTATIHGGSYKQINEKNQEYNNTKNTLEQELIANNTLIDRESIPVLESTHKLDKQHTVQFNQNATCMIFSLYGNMSSSTKNDLFVYDNVGTLIVKLSIFPEVNKVTVNEWHQTENVFDSSRAWPKNIAFSFSDSMIRMNNVMIYEFPDYKYRLYKYLRVDAKSVKEVQLLSLNGVSITAEEVIKNHH